MAGNSKAELVITLIIAGGSGTRFFPVSTAEKPKQFLNLFNNKSLLRNTWERALTFSKPEHIYVCGLQSQKDLFLKDGINPDQLILEPSARNTAAAIAFSLITLRKKVGEHFTMVVCPADHHIENESKFTEVVRQGIELAQTGRLVTVGIVPTFAHTGYGYIEKGNALPKAGYAVKKFHEKPNLETATAYLHSHQFFWNAGLFIWNYAAIHSEFSEYHPDLWNRLDQAGEVASTYEKLPSLPVDVAIMEKTKLGAVVPGNFGWSDLGSWSSLVPYAPFQQDNNASFTPNLKTVESKNCLVFTSASKKVYLIDVQNLMVVEQGEHLLICPKASDQKVKQLNGSST